MYIITIISDLYSISPFQPKERFLHSAVGMSDYMVVMGGGTSEADFDSSVWAYKYNCNQWSNVSPGGTYTALFC